MEPAQVEWLGFSEMPHTGHKRLPEGPILGPSGKDFVDGRGRCLTSVDVLLYMSVSAAEHLHHDRVAS